MSENRTEITRTRTMRPFFPVFLSGILMLGCRMSAPVPVFSQGENFEQGQWIQMESGSWKYLLAEGWYAADDMLEIDGKYYLFDHSGDMMTGFQYWQDVLYYFDSSGAMKTGWLHVPDAGWYYCTDTGLKTGWLLDPVDHDYYHFDEQGQMSQSSWISYQGRSYYCDRSGAMIAGRWATIADQYYWFDEEGKSTPDNVKGIAIINKKHPLPADYDPKENPTAAAALNQMIDEMQKLGLNVSRNYSGYRSYAVQKSLYEGYCMNQAPEIVDTYSARAGFSEHQSGLAFDLKHANGALITGQNEAAWIDAHAHEYGFIVRYKKEWQDITGYMAEPWHVRYVGGQAGEIHASGLPLESWLGVEGGDYISPLPE